jgi:hypothetical protein
MSEVMAECTRYEKLNDGSDENSDVTETTETIEITEEPSEIEHLYQVCRFNDMIVPRRVMVCLRECSVSGCDRSDYITFNQHTSYADIGSFNHPTAMWVFCPDHDGLAAKTEAKYAITQLCSPISPYFGATVQVEFEGQLESMVLSMLRLSKNKFPCEPIAAFYFKNLIVHIKLDKVINTIKNTQKRELEDWEIQINNEYLKYAPPELLNKFPADLF